MPQHTHDTLPPLSTQLQALIQHGWEQEVLSRLPVGYEQQARRTGAFVRAKGLKCVADLLQGLLAYVLCARSFRHLGAWAVLIGLANLSHVACTLPAEAAERARAKARRKASKKPHQLKEETLFLCGWLLLFTSLATHEWCDQQVLALYRARWQIELVIKRDARKCSGSPNCVARRLAPMGLPFWCCCWPGPSCSRRCSTHGRCSPKPPSNGRSHESRCGLLSPGRAIAHSSSRVLTPASANVAISQ